MANGLALRESASLGLSGSVQINSMAEVFRLATALAAAEGFVPSAYVGAPNAVAAAILTGVELGMGPMEALREIHVVKGRPTLSAACMLGRVIKAGITVEWLETSDKAARLRLTRAGVSYEQAWTIEEAKRAGLLTKDGPWHQYPGAMLRARCVSAAVRAFCPDVVGGGGLYTPEEARDIEPPTRAQPIEVVQAPTHDEVGEVINAALSEEQRIGELLKAARTSEDIESARRERSKAKQRGLVDDAAFERLGALGREASERIRGVAASKEEV